MMEKVSTGCLIVPKVLKFLGGSLKFLEGLLHDCERRPGKSVPLLLFYLYHNREGINVLFTFSPMGFSVYPSFLMFCDEERIK